MTAIHPVILCGGSGTRLWPMSRKALGLVLREAVRRNRVKHGLLYLQVTRGNPGDRDFAFPDPDAVAQTVTPRRPPGARWRRPASETAPSTAAVTCRGAHTSETRVFAARGGGGQTLQPPLKASPATCVGF